MYINVTGLSGANLRIFNVEGRKQLYFREGIPPGVIRVGLPVHKSKIFISSSEPFTVQEISPLVVYDLPFHVPPETRRNYSISDIQAEAAKLPSPGRMFTDRPLVQYDPDRLKNLPQQIAAYVLRHELAHYFFTNEELTDLFATYLYLRDGYNLSGAAYALTRVLHRTPENVKRMLTQGNYLQYLNDNADNLLKVAS